MNEASFLINYFEARRSNNIQMLNDYLLVLPVLLSLSPTNAFIMTLALLDKGGIKADLLKCKPDYNTDKRYALTGTAVDFIEQYVLNCSKFSSDLQSLLGTT